MRHSGRFQGRGKGGRGRERRGTGKRHGRKSYRETPDSLPIVTETRAEGSSDLEEELNENIEEEEEEEDDDNDKASGKPKPYNLLLQSLKTPQGQGGTKRKSKRLKLASDDFGVRRGDSVVLENEKDGEEVQSGTMGDEPDESDEGSEEEQDFEDSSDHQPGGVEDRNDPFESHFSSPSEEFLRRAQAAMKSEWQVTKLTQPGGGIGKMTIMVPEGVDGSLLQFLGEKHSGKLSDLKLKPRLQSERCAFQAPLQRALAPAIFSYTDLFFSSRTLENLPQLRHLYSLHAINHILKTRDRVLKNNSRLSRLSAVAEETGKAISPADLELRDQGFTRPKVLIIVPTRNSCMEVVDTVVGLCQPDQQENRKRFNEQFGFPPDVDTINDSKPEDFKALFRGNHDDLFRLGIKFTRKSIKFFSKFYNSDIIIASPLGLRMAIGGDGEVYEEEDNVQKGKKKRVRSKKSNKDYDFLSSIEIIIVDHADALLMQNWEHLDLCFQHLNLIPKEAHDTDFSRVRNWCLDGLSKYLRQTILLSSYITPEMNFLFNHHMLNICGRVRIQPVSFDGELIKLQQLGNVTQTFYRFEPTAPAADPDNRFKYFTKTLLPSHILRSKKGGTAINNVKGVLIFVPSYFDFVRVRNLLDSPNFPTPVSFGAISEETPVAEVSRARSHFLTGRHRILLYSGRAHHFRRLVIKGVREVLFYQLPENPLFYDEIGSLVLYQPTGNALEEEEVQGGSRNIRCIFSKYDAVKLERVVGTKRIGSMVSGKGDVFEFL